MRTILSCAAMAAMMMLAWGADGATATQTKTPAKKTAAKKGTAPAKKATTSAATKKGGATAAHKKATSTTASRKKGATATTASARGGKKAPAKGVTWRNRQTTPSPDRYREIQGALAAKGFLQPEDATGTWNQASADALKRFQAEQNLESTGKINSLSLIALGLGPHRETPPVAAKPAPPVGQ